MGHVCPSLPCSRGLSQAPAELTLHCITTWGLGKCLYFGMSQKYIFVQSGAECLFLWKGWGLERALGWLRQWALSEGALGQFVCPAQRVNCRLGTGDRLGWSTCFSSAVSPHRYAQTLRVQLATDQQGPRPEWLLSLIHISEPTRPY